MDNLFTRTAVLGAISGMRSMSGLALTSRYLSNSPDHQAGNRFLDLLNEKRTANVLTFLAIGEMIGDKLPNIPNRVAKGPLLGRGLLGGIAGAALYDHAGKSALLGGFVARTAAVISTFISYKLRQKVAEESHFPDPMIGVVEDLIVYLAGVSALTTDE